VGIDVGDINLFLDGPTPPAQQQESVSNQPLCPPPTINAFVPFSAYTSAPSPQIIINGTNLYGNTQVFIGNQPCSIIENTDTKLVFVPTQKVSGKIKVVTEYGEKETTTQFQFFFKN